MASNLLAPIASSNRQAQIVVTSIVFIVAISIDLITYLGEYNGPPIRSDGFGYYVYLPALLHGDIFFNFLKDSATWDPAGHYGSVRPGLSNVPQGFLDQYAIGTATLQLPFFMLALLFQKIRGLTTWGFEPAFQFANAVSAVCYLAAGSLILLNSLMARLIPVAASIFVLVAVFGTNTIMYGSYDGAFSHVYSYFLCCCTVAIVSSPRREFSADWRRGLALGEVIGLATMVRPTNLIGAPIILLILPTRPKDAAWTVAAFSAAFVVSTLPQTAWWLATTGSPISYSYHQEGFDFAHPHLLEFLFSVRKGVLSTPVGFQARWAE